MHLNWHEDIHLPEWRTGSGVSLDAIMLFAHHRLLVQEIG